MINTLSTPAILLALFLLVFPGQMALAQLLIVEVQIAEDKADHDFIKIYNPADNGLDISGYKLRKRTSTGGESSIRVFPGGSKITAKGYFVWANSKDDFHLTVGANAWSSATLAKKNSIALLNPENVILDALAWGESQSPFVLGSPFLENPDANQQLKRKKANGNYQDTNNNSQDFYLYPASQSSQPKSENVPKEETQPESAIYPSGIIINEILPNTALGTRDEEGEYIEIFNQNTFEVDLSNWKIEDVMGITTAYVFPKGTKIAPRGFLLLYRPASKITLNNEADGLNLIQPDGKIIDSLSYEKAPKGESYSKIPIESSNEYLTAQTLAGWVWSSALTPGSENIVPAQEETSSADAEVADAEVKPLQAIDINTALAKELQKLTGVGPVLAQRIIEARPFYSLDELTKVSGIGPKALEEIKKQGLAWVDPTLEPPKSEKETESFAKGTAAAAEPIRQTPASFFVFIIALVLAVFSGGIFLILKKRLKKS